MASPVETVFQEVQRELLAFGQARSVDFKPWLDTNRLRLVAMTRLIDAVAPKVQEPEQVLAEIQRLVTARLPREAAWFDRHRKLLSFVTTRTVRSLQGQSIQPEEVAEANSLPPDLRTPSERTAANIRAVQILARGSAVLPAERELLRQYSGWGGLSIKGLVGKIPASWMPEQRGLIHEYYTPTAVARAVAETLQPRLSELAKENGTIVALEPSAGIGRFIEALSSPNVPTLRWHAAEYSRVSGRLLQALRPDVDVYIGPFEEWLGSHAELAGTIDLVVSNPPYGERGRARHIDRDKQYDERRAYAYQLRRALDLLRPGGIGVFLIPAGFLTGQSSELVELRRRVLLRHHLMAAFRLPSENEEKRPLFPGALLVTDLLFFRARGGELDAIPAEDQAIVEGRYFAEHPTHILGTEEGELSDEDNAAKPRWGYQVRGNFTGIPAWTERPQCRDCTLTPYQSIAKPKRASIVLSDSARDGLQLARRTSQYLAELARGDEQALKRAAALHGDLRDALVAWHAQPSDEKLPVAALVTKSPELQPLFSVWGDGSLITELATAPVYKPRFSGSSEDAVAQAHFLYGAERAMTLAELHAFHTAVGGTLTEPEIFARLIGAGFCVDGTQLVPEAAYYTGLLWDKYDRARAAADAGDSQSAAQAARLLQAISPVTFAELTVEPRLGWLPLPVLQEFVNHVLSQHHHDGAQYQLERVGSILTLADVEYPDLAGYSKPLQLLLGYLNHDLVYFRPKTTEDEDLEKKRQALAQQYVEMFRSWLEDQAELQAMIVEAFNRLFRGWVQPTYDTGDLAVARWNPQYPLYGYQNAGVRRLVANHGGGLFFDVGLGKTRTMLAALALARQQGWARRAVIVVPGSVIWNWVAEIERVLPDFRIVILGAKKKTLLRGERKGQLESDTDTPRERADKWERFKAGLYDVALLTYSSLGRSQIRVETLLPLIRSNSAVQRELGFQQRAVESRIAYLSTRKGRLNDKQRAELAELRQKFGGLQPTERREAIKSEREEAFAARVTQLPEGQEPDPGIYWEDLGIDWIAFDESHTGKNLWTVGAREGGEPRFLGAPQEGSSIAWQMFFRAYIVRQKAGGSGVHLADATPAKNSPLEFLSLLSFIDDQVWARLGIGDAEQYLTQYLRIEHKLIQATSLEVIEAPCVVGFQNLDQLREVLFRYGEFRTAKEVGLKIPEPIVRRIEVDLDDAQEEKYQRYIAAYEAALSSVQFNPESRLKALGILQRMALVAVHAELDEGPGGDGPDGDPDEPKPKRAGWTYGTASRARNYASPKFDKIAELIAEKKDCGHIVFLENNAAHYWLRERLATAGIAKERIAVLNGETAPTTLVRQRIAEGFTNDAALYDVVIANRVAYEGLNLQNRTCAIYHGDLPWEPATLQQRNGRGQRQGNRYDVIYIYYVLAKRSMDMARFQLIAGKREWMAELIESAASETNNPAAQADQSPEDWLMYLSRDPEKTQALFAAKQAQQAEAERDSQRKMAWARVRGIAMRQRELAGAADVYQHERLRREIVQFVEDLDRTDPDIWPWKFAVPLIASAQRTLSFAPAHEGAIWEGARFQRRNPAGAIIEAGHYGRVQYAPRLAIGYRPGGEVRWAEIFPDEAQQRWSYTQAADWKDIAWPSLTEEIGGAMQDFLRQLRSEGVWIYHEARFDLAPDDWLSAIWTQWGGAITEALSQSRSSYQVRLPIVTSAGLSPDIADLGNGRVLPFTEVGYQEFLTLARESTRKWTELDSIAQWWWLRHLPRTFLSEKHSQPAAIAA